MVDCGERQTSEFHQAAIRSRQVRVTWFNDGIGIKGIIRMLSKKASVKNPWTSEAVDCMMKRALLYVHTFCMALFTF